MAGAPRILIVEDEGLVAEDIKETLAGFGYRICGIAGTGETAVVLAGKYHPDLILMDITLAGEMDGITAAGRIREQYSLPVIFLTSHSNDPVIQKAKMTEPFGYILKPFEPDALRISIEMALYKHRIDAELRISEERYRTLAEMADDSILIVTTNYCIAYANRHFQSTVCSAHEKTTGKRIDALFPAESAQIWIRNIDTAVRSKSPVRSTDEIRFPGRNIWLESSFVPLYGAEGAVISVMVVSRDVTDDIRIRKAIEEKGIARIEKDMEEFQILNDQIRNPLQIISALASMGTGLDAEKILGQVRIIDDLVTRLDRGWIESEKVHGFLLRHYYAGLRTPPPGRNEADNNGIDPTDSHDR